MHLRGRVLGVVLCGILLSCLGLAQNQQPQHSEVKTNRDWKRLRKMAHTAEDYRKLAEWCRAQAEVNNKKASTYQAELREYYSNSLGAAHPKYPPPDATLKNQIAHCQDLARYWNGEAAHITRRMAELEVT